MHAVDVEVEWYDGPRGVLRPLFELAEDSTSRLDGYLPLGRVLVARRHGALVGHLQLVESDIPGEVELTNMAVREADQRTGVGSALVGAALEVCRREGVRRLVVGTGAADVTNLRFYQR